jgi:hypothetical protein
MKSKTAVIVLCLAVIVGYSMAASQKATAQVADQSSGGKIEGTWRVQVTVRNCQTGDELRTFPAILTFAQGGNLTGTTTVVPVALRSPDHGVWNFKGAGNYRAVSEAFLFNPAGAWVSTQRITQAIDLAPNSNTFTSNASVEFFDTLGNTTSTGCSTAVATRME